METCQEAKPGLRMWTDTLWLAFVFWNSLTMCSWLAWNSLCRPCWHQTWRDPSTCLCLPWTRRQMPSIMPSFFFLAPASLVLAAVSQAGLKLRAILLPPSLEPELKMCTTTPSPLVTSFFQNKSLTMANLSCLLFNCWGGGGWQLTESKNFLNQQTRTLPVCCYRFF